MVDLPSTQVELKPHDSKQNSDADDNIPDIHQLQKEEDEKVEESAKPVVTNLWDCDSEREYYSDSDYEN